LSNELLNHEKVIKNNKTEIVQLKNKINEIKDKFNNELNEKENKINNYINNEKGKICNNIDNKYNELKLISDNIYNQLKKNDNFIIVTVYIDFENVGKDIIFLRQCKINYLGSNFDVDDIEIFVDNFKVPVKYKIDGADFQYNEK